MSKELEASNPEGINQYTNAASHAASETVKADHASKKAELEDTMDAHDQAYRAHGIAYLAHRDAGSEAFRQNLQKGGDAINNKTASEQKFHADQMAMHRAKEREHLGAMNKKLKEKRGSQEDSFSANNAASEGANKLEAGDFRGNQHMTPEDVAEDHSAAARLATRTAMKASRSADDGDDDDDSKARHNTAALAHEAARQAHETAAAKCLAADDADGAEDHTAKAGKHQAKKEAHTEAMAAIQAEGGAGEGGAVDAKSGTPTGGLKLEASNPEGINQYTKGSGGEISDKAHEATEEADKASRRADKESGNAEQNQDRHAIAEGKHDNAADAHEAAQKHHSDEAVKAAKEGDSDKAEKHIALAEHHKAMVEYHSTKWTHHSMNAKDAKGETGLAAKSGDLQPCALECAHASVVLDDGVMMYMPGGTHTITPHSDDGPVTVTVKVDASAAERIEAQRAALDAKGKTPFFSVQHETEIAAFWPKRFFWGTRIDATGKAREGVWVEGEITDSGKKAIEGKDFRTFSPTFFVDAIRTDPSNPARIVCNDKARANMGALENDPAFTSISPLWARSASLSTAKVENHAGATGKKQTTEEKTTMAQETIAELQARNDKLEQKITELKAKDDAIAKAELRAAQAEQKEIGTQIRLQQTETRMVALEASETKRKETDAESAVQRMVASGKIPVRETEMQDNFKKKFIADPSLIPLLAGDASSTALAQIGGGSVALQGVEGGRMSLDGTAGQMQAGAAISGGFSLKGALTKYFELMAANANVDFRDKDCLTENYRRKGALALEAAGVFKTDLQPNVARWEHIPHRTMGEIIGLKARSGNGVKVNVPGMGPIGLQAADFTDANLGTLSGTLVLQRTLPLFRYKFPELMNLFTDFSDTPGLLNQTEQTRIVVQLATQKYDTALDATGRPKGWSTVVAAQTTDVPLTLTDYISVPIVFSNATLAATNRRIFDEQSSLAITSLAQYFMGMLTDLATKANYNAYAVVNGTLVPTQYVSYVKDIQAFSLADLDLLSAAMTSNKVPQEDRAVLLNPTYFAKLRSDPKLSFLYATQGGRNVADASDFITEFKLPKLSGFAPYEAPYLPASTPVAAPTTNNVVGFAFQKSGAILKSRLPNDFTQALGVMIPGSVTTVTDPDTKISIMLVQYINLTSGYAEWRPEVMLGAAVGDKRGGLVITSN